MNAFQFDECSADQKYAANCQKSGHSIVRNYPKRHKKLKDPEMLEHYLAKKDGTLVTFDHRIWSQHSESVPLSHPGIIAIRNLIYTMTHAIAQKMIEKLKADFPDWSVVSWANSLVTLTNDGVRVERKTPSGFEEVLYRDFKEADWQEALKGCLQTNATQ
jgi:hypothetical protein